jgi:hypothetical protein
MLSFMLLRTNMSQLAFQLKKLFGFKDFFLILTILKRSPLRFGNNSSTIHLLFNPKFHRLMKHVKHINLQFHMLREFSKQKEVALLILSSASGSVECGFSVTLSKVSPEPCNIYKQYYINIKTLQT